MAKNLALLGWVVAAAALLIGCAADTYTVGDDLGWALPPVSDSAYEIWARTKEFDVGDVITFNWDGQHNVVQVTKEGYDNCSAGNNSTLGPVQTVSPYSFTINSTTPYYFICTVGDHCSRGQKLEIEVGRWWSAAPPSLGGAALSAAFVAVVASVSLMV